MTMPQIKESGVADGSHVTRVLVDLDDGTELEIKVVDEGLILDRTDDTGEVVATWAATFDELAEMTH